MSDWREDSLAWVRKLTMEALPGVSETRKWAKAGRPDGVPVWEQGGILFTGETYKNKVKLTFAKGASLADPGKLFNASLDAGTRRAIDIREGETLDASAFKALVQMAAKANEKS
ncbi:YdhG-like domain-containing protein [Sphingomonas antarctica]|uniref:DUF1801 domain-containing protein n=1 Tax=Sphingomonas antarctica TaxID=2040274 RepID=UPI0039E94225